MKKTIALIVLVAVAILGLWLWKKPSATTATPERPIIVAFENDVASLDPVRLGDVFGLRVAYQIVEGLTKLDTQSQVAGAVAESWQSSPDLTKWTFRLRDGVKFHPYPAAGGAEDPVTAEDVVYSFTRMLSKDAVTAGPLAGLVAGAKAYQDGKATIISGLHAVSPREVEFTLLRADSMFPGRISSPAYGIVSRRVVEAAGTDFGQKAVTGTGPFRFVQRQGNDLMLEGYKGFRTKPASVPGRVIFRAIKEDAVRLAEARAGRVSATYATPPMLQGLVEKRNGAFVLSDSAAGAFQIESFPILNTYFVAFNYPRIHPDFRKAISLALDRDEIIAAAVPRSGIPAAGPIPLACAGYKTAAQPKRDLDGAKAALERFRKAQPDAPLKLRLLVHELAQAVPTGEVVQSQLKPLGIEVELVQQSFNAVLDSIRKGDFDATVLGFEYQYSLPQLILENFYTSATIPLPNVFHYSNPANDSAIAALFSDADSPAQLKKVSDIEKAMVDEAPGVFLYQTSQIVLVQPGLRGLRFNAANFPDLTAASWK
jgi:ABC-type transport system substrate-binding protein